MARLPKVISLLLLAFGIANCGTDSVTDPRPQVGTIRILTEVVGFALTGRVLVGLNDSVVTTIHAGLPVDIDSIPVGTYTLNLASVDAPCVLEGSASVSLTVAADSITSTTIQLSCLPTLGGRVVFSSYRDGNWELYAVNPDGSEPINLTRNSVFDGYPSVGAGDTVLLHSRQANQGMYLVRTTASAQDSLAPGTAADISRAPTSEIAFMSITPNGEILRQPLWGSPAVNLTNSPTWEGHPAWSPDGAMLAVNTLRTGKDGIDLLTADGTFVLSLTDSLDAASWPSWSPDGTRIVFGGTRSGDQSWAIYVIDTAGTNLQRIADGPGEDIEPVWSRDGLYIAFATNRDGNYEIYLMEANGSNLVNLTQNSADDLSPVFAGPPPGP